MKIKITKITFEEIESKHFKFKRVDNNNIIYTAVAPDNQEKIFIHWVSGFGRLESDWFSKNAVSKFMQDGDWIVTEVLDK